MPDSARSLFRPLSEPSVNFSMRQRAIFVPRAPRFGSFVAVYGQQNTIDMIDGALARSA